MQTLAGVLQPTRGRVLTVGPVSSLIELTAGFHRELSGTQNVLLQGVLLGLRRSEVRAQLDAIIEFSELDDDVMREPLRMYSAGMGLRLGFALVVIMEPSVLLIDEVLAVGDELFRVKCMNKVHDLQANGCAVVMVSHDLELVAQRCDRVGLLEAGEIRLIDKPAPVIAEYRRRGLHVTAPDEGLPETRRMFRQA